MDANIVQVEVSVKIIRWHMKYQLIYINYLPLNLIKRIFFVLKKRLKSSLSFYDGLIRETLFDKG